ncbi:MAG: membrane protein insertase YidC [Candidatus Hydrogenedentes bacterium]|nr:membrane protein insertase YidC [Candidatus Hydrogenedentota bacterium]
MLDDDQDKSLARNQLFAIVLMTALVLVYFNYFAPQPQPRPPQQTSTPQAVDPNSNKKPADMLVAEAPETPVTPAAAPSAWPNLPPVPEQTSPADDEITIKSGDLQLVFTRIGARLKKAIVLLHDNGEDQIQLVPERAAPDADVVYPFGLRFSDEHLRDELDRRRFDVESQTDSSVTFLLTLPGVAELRKTFTFSDAAHVVDVKIEYKNLESSPRVLGMDQNPAFILSWGPNVDSKDLTKGVQQSLIWRLQGKNDWIQTSKMTPAKDGTPHTERIPDPEWIGIKSAYFLVAFKPEFAPCIGYSIGDHEQFRFGLAVPRSEVAPGASLASSAKVYIGPSERNQLKRAWATLETSHRFFQYPELMNWFATMLLSLLNWFYGIIPNYGVAIILLTILVRTAMFPLTIKQMRSMKRMQLLAPEMEKIKEKCGDDPQELNKRMMEMYRERGVNPLGGCFPLLLQMPVFIALYRMLWSTYELRGAPFIWWIKDLSEPDKLLHFPFLAGIPFFGQHIQYLNVLPILCAVAMIVSTKLMPMSGPTQNPQQKAMMTIMPVFFSLICYSFASGLNLYILVSTVLGIAQNRLIRVSATDVPEKKAPKKKRHWYAAAQAKRRQAQKELKKKS